MNYLFFPDRRLVSKFLEWLQLIALLTVGTLLGMAAEPYINLTGLTMIYVGLVAYAAYTLSRNKSLLCALLSVACLNFFFVPPRFTFHVDTREHILALFALSLVALLINRLSARLKSETESAHLNERRARQLQALAMNLSEAESLSEVFTLALSTYAQAFEQGVLLYLANEDIVKSSSSQASNKDLLEEHRNGLLACIKEAKLIGAGSGRWNDLPHCYLPIGTKDEPAAVALLNVNADDASHDHALVLASLVNHALRRLKLTHSVAQAQDEIARQQMQTLFLSAISHDLRTPLSVVIGAASALQAQNDKLSQADQEKLVSSILSEARYLGEITENTMQLLRLEHNQKGIHCDWESPEEILGSVLARIKQRDISHRIKHQVRANLPLIYVDAVLMAQLLTNLIDNALKYSDDKVLVDVALLTRSDTPVLQISVKDRGPGIPQEEREHIFETYTHAKRHDQSSQRGAGLGLAVCKAIARAHQAEIFVTERQHGGSNFVLRIPVPQQINVPEIEATVGSRIENQDENQVGTHGGPGKEPQNAPRSHPSSRKESE